MNNNKKRIGIIVGAGYVPGLNAVIKGVAMAAANLDWDIVGIMDGFDGLLYPEKYPSGGLVPLNSMSIENLDALTGSILGQSRRLDPFNVRTINELEMVEEVDISDQILAALKENQIDAIVAIVGDIGMTIMYKLHKKGLNTVCIPRSVENDVASTAVSFGFNTTLNFTIEMLDSVKRAAQSARKVAVVEVLGKQAGWIALQSGIAAGADAILIPETTTDLKNVAAHLKKKITAEREYGLVVVAEGARISNKHKGEPKVSSFKASLSPLATSDTSSEHVINKSGLTAENVSMELQLLIAEEIYPLVLSEWARGGTPTAVDRQLGMAYGAASIEALNLGQDGVMVSFMPPEIKFIPLFEAINKVRTVPKNSEFLKVAESLGIYCAKEETL